MFQQVDFDDAMMNKPILPLIRFYVKLRCIEFRQLLKPGRYGACACYLVENIMPPHAPPRFAPGQCHDISLPLLSFVYIISLAKYRRAGFSADFMIDAYLLRFIFRA